jgi:hypothetical protein
MRDPGRMVWPTTFSTLSFFLLPVRPEQPVAAAEGCRTARSAAMCRLLRRPVPSVPPSSATRDLVLHQTCTSRGTPHFAGACSWASSCPPVGVPAAAAVLGQLGRPGGRHGHARGIWLA